MESGTWLRMSIWGVGGLFGLMVAALVVDSSGPALRTDGIVVSTRFVEGMTTTTDVKVGDMSVPIRTEIPGAWIAEIDSALLGRVEVPVDEDKLHPGQRVYLDYHVGKLSGQASVVGLRLQSEMIVEH
jgi:hypothetical protein